MGGSQDSRGLTRWGPGRVIAVIVALALAGCGGNDDDDGSVELPAVERPPDVLIDGEVIEATREGSPERALYQWWRALQFDDTEGVEESYTRGVDLDDLDRQMEEVGTRQSRPVVLDVDVAGDEAKLFAAIERFEFDRRNAEAPLEPAGETPAVFNFEREGDEWKLSDNRYLEERLRAQREGA